MSVFAKGSRTGSHVLDDIAQVIGEDAAFALAAEFIGQRLYVPMTPDTNPRIALAIGAENAAKFCDVFYRTMVCLPIMVVLERCVPALAAKGVPKREIANSLRIREARVYAILKRVRDREEAAKAVAGPAGQPA